MNLRGNGDKKPKPVVVAIDKDKGSQAALKWAVDNLLYKGSSVVLLHVKVKPSSGPSLGSNDDVSKVIPLDSQTKELFLPFRCFCTRKDIHVTEVLVEEADIVKGICDYAKTNVSENLVMGATMKSGYVSRFKGVDNAANVSKLAPEFCTVHVIAKGKLSSTRPASVSAPNEAHLQNSTNSPSARNNARMPQANGNRGPLTERPVGAMLERPAGAMIERPMNAIIERPVNAIIERPPDRPSFGAKPAPMDDSDAIKSPFTRISNSNRSYGDLTMPDSDISFVSSARPPGMDKMTPIPGLEFDMGNRLSTGSLTDGRVSFGSQLSNARTSSESSGSFGVFSSSSLESPNNMWSGSQNMEDVESEMRRLREELKQTIDMYSSACKEALSAKQKAVELHRWKVEEQQKLDEARQAEEAALAVAEREKERCRAAIQKAEAAQRMAELEAQRRMNAEMKARLEAEEKNKVLDKLAQNDVRYRKYTLQEIEIATEHFAASRKIGEGGYGPVYKGYLDHTQVAIKILRPDAAQGRSQFQQEIEVLSCIRHPNMVLLLGACPDHGCLVYEYMANGSLEDLLFRPGNNVLPWQIRFRIAAEIGTGLLFLHQSKPEPLVHRDLKPGNILLDRNLVSKISDVGLARLVPPSVADSVTQYHMTSAAGTFCYIDPEYQQTGMLGVKSDVYSLGVMLLQIITAKPPMGLTHYVERSIEKGNFAEMLDPAVPDWPVEEAKTYAKLALRCVELRRKDRPDLSAVLPELERLRDFAEQSMPSFSLSTGGSGGYSDYSRSLMSEAQRLSYVSGYTNSQPTR